MGFTFHICCFIPHWSNLFTNLFQFLWLLLHFFKQQICKCSCDPQKKKWVQRLAFLSVQVSFDLFSSVSSKLMFSLSIFFGVFENFYCLSFSSVIAKVKRSKSFSSSKSLSFKNGRSSLRVFSFLKPVKTECHNCPYKNSLGNVCELSCFETNEIFCLSEVILITNSLANSDKVFVAQLNLVNNINELDFLRCARWIYCSMTLNSNQVLILDMLSVVVLEK